AGQFSNFNLPQYYEIVQINGELEVIPYRSQGQMRDNASPARELGSATG
ncbi:MAG: class I adenylate cyclase, partial [Aeromonas sp.]|nr:class I adenylate cyclase [Aeromonas sp.]